MGNGPLTAAEVEEMEALMLEQLLQEQGGCDAEPLTEAELARLDALLARHDGQCSDCMRPVEYPEDDWCPWCRERRASE